MGVNGRSLLGLGHGDAVSLLANSSQSGPGPGQLTIAFRRLGRIPVSPPTSSGPGHGHGSPSPTSDNDGHHQDGGDFDQTQHDASPILQELAMVTEKVNVFVHLALILLFLLNPIYSSMFQLAVLSVVTLDPILINVSPGPRSAGHV